MSLIRTIAVFLCGLVSISPCVAQVPFFGNCPNVAVVTNFQASRYLGKWYEQEKYFAVFQLGGKCVSATYSDRGNGVVGVFNRQQNSVTGSPSDIQGTATVVSKNGEAKLSVVFPNMPVSIPAPYWVLDTDYDNYAVVWGCNDFGIFHTRNLWILTRQRNPPVEVLHKAYRVLDTNNLNKNLLIRTDQSNCKDGF